jgi:hypothetical protein
MSMVADLKYFHMYIDNGTSLCAVVKFVLNIFTHVLCCVHSQRRSATPSIGVTPERIRKRLNLLCLTQTTCFLSKTN